MMLATYLVPGTSLGSLKFSLLVIRYRLMVLRSWFFALGTYYPLPLHSPTP